MQRLDEETERALKYFNSISIASSPTGVAIPIDAREIFADKKYKTNSWLAVNHAGSMESFLMMIRSKGEACHQDLEISLLLPGS